MLESEELMNWNKELLEKIEIENFYSKKMTLVLLVSTYILKEKRYHN